MDISNDISLKKMIFKYTQIGNLLGSSSIFFLYYASDQLVNLETFQRVSIIISIVSVVLMWYFARYAFSARDLEAMENPHPYQHVFRKWGVTDPEYDEHVTVHVVQEPSFLAFAVINFFQEYHRIFLSSFLLIFGDQLVDDVSVSTFERSVFDSGSLMLAKVYYMY